MLELDPNVDINKIDLNEITNQVSELSSSLVTVKDLQWVKRFELNEIRNEESEKKESYSALCCSSRPVNHLNRKFKPFTIDQKTSLRVLHRRLLATFQRTIESLKFRREPTRDDRYLWMS